MNDKAAPEALYNNRAAVPDHPAVMARWKVSAEAARAVRPPVVLSYGSSLRETIDLFSAASGGGRATCVFFHGGYWQALDPYWFSGLAPAFDARGLDLAVVGYDLCPQVTLPAIVDQARRATAHLADRCGPLVAVGHSAGGHLAATLVAEGRVRSAMAISGLFDLEPLIPTSLNAALGLDSAIARALSPIHAAVPTGAVLDCVVGGNETAGFLDQSRTMAARWTEGGGEGRLTVLEGLNHFTVLDPLFDPDSAVMDRLVALSSSSAG